MPTTALITADELACMPGGESYELVRGKLVRVNPANWDHARMAVLVGARLLAFVEPRRLGTVMVEAGFVLERDPDTMRSPAVSFVGTARTAGLPRRGFFPGAPDLAIEIVSPENTLRAHYSRKPMNTSPRAPKSCGSSITRRNPRE